MRCIVAALAMASVCCVSTARNVADIEQIGNVQVAKGVQSNETNDVIIRQDGRGSRASVVQHGSGNSASVTQSGGDGGEAFIMQTGGANKAQVIQETVAGANLLNLWQSGIEHSADVTQEGGLNRIDLEQSGDRNNATLAQRGDENSMDVQQLGDHTLRATQSGSQSVLVFRDAFGGPAITITQTGVGAPPVIITNQ